MCKKEMVNATGCCALYYTGPTQGPVRFCFGSSWHGIRFYRMTKGFGTSSAKLIHTLLVCRYSRIAS